MNTSHGIICSVALLFASLHLSASAVNKPKRVPVEWKLDRIECQSTVCQPFYCKLHRKTRDLQILNAGCNLVEPQHNVHVQFKMHYRYNRYKPFLYDLNVDVCNTLGNKTRTQPVIALVMPYIYRYTNFNGSCPLFGNITVKDLYYENNMLKGTLLPSGQYRIDTRVYNPKTNETLFAEQSYLTHSSTFSAVDLAMG